MDDWYNPSDPQNDQLLDELLCEYVDGTMDPCVRSAFDELLSTNPAIARQVQDLAETQQILKRTGCNLCAPRQFQSKLRARLNAETGKIDLYGVTPAEVPSETHFGRYVLLAVVFFLAGVALPRHSEIESRFEAPRQITSTFQQQLKPALLMTPASQPENVYLAPLVVDPQSLIIDEPFASTQVHNSETQFSMSTD